MGSRWLDDLNYVHLAFQNSLWPAHGALEGGGGGFVNGVVGGAWPFAELAADVAGRA